MSYHSPKTTHHSPNWDRIPETARASLLILTTVLLTGLCTLLACRDDNPRGGKGDLDLLDDTSSLNLNLTSAAACAESSGRAALSDSSRPIAVTTHYHGVAAPDNSAQGGPQVLDFQNLMLRAVVNEESFAIPTRHHGDSPMMRQWKLLGLDIILMGALAAPVLAEQHDGPNSDVRQDDPVLKEVRELKTSISDLAKAIKSLQDSTLNTNLRIEKAQGDIDGLKRQVGQLQLEEMDGVRRQLAQIQKDVDDLKARTARISTYQPQAPTPAPSTGRIRIVNAFTVPQTIVLNNRAYPVNPGAVLNVEGVPVGMFAYEVLGVQAAVNRSLAANETFTITIH